MTGPTSPTNAAACLALAQRQIGDASDWSPQEWADQLAEDGVLRLDPPVLHYRPYRSALAYLLRPGVQARTEGDVSEQYADPKALAERLRELDAEWLAHRIPPEEAATAETFDGAVEWGGW
ncbi:hypothetical protein [Deinococcus humi]|uniref:Uncharacterized protein n=1 Tax=Deinococcus humi TaxID=662880 RepID=A0A7W8NFT8_9DEIO|nr:hypothetical protein [Deinococcus humi]MBB5363088.1 hypothetical protein [Deinococcus humi]GGO24747.1 hypothetical protein GCM10008949_13980 [Deinococcus humi]